MSVSCHFKDEQTLMESSSVIGDNFFLDFGVTNEDLLGVLNGVLVFEDGVGGSEFTFVGV